MTTLLLIQALAPNVLIKGEDWTEENIIGGDFVKSKGNLVLKIHPSIFQLSIGIGP